MKVKCIQKVKVRKVRSRVLSRRCSRCKTKVKHETMYMMWEKSYCGDVIGITRTFVYCDDCFNYIKNSKEIEVYMKESIYYKHLKYNDTNDVIDIIDYKLTAMLDDLYMFRVESISSESKVLYKVVDNRTDNMLGILELSEEDGKGTDLFNSIGGMCARLSLQLKKHILM